MKSPRISSKLTLTRKLPINSKRKEQVALLFFWFWLFFEPEDASGDQDEDEIKDPANESAPDNPDDGKNDVKDVLVRDGTAKAIDAPEDINDRQAEEDLDESGSTIQPIAECFHFFLLPQ